MTAPLRHGNHLEQGTLYAATCVRSFPAFNIVVLRTLDGNLRLLAPAWCLVDDGWLRPGMRCVLELRSREDNRGIRRWFAGDVRTQMPDFDPEIFKLPKGIM